MVIYIYIFACLREALICPFLFSYSPLIRILGDRFPWQVKSAILSTLTIIISKGGLALKPFLPQLQTTFVKCLQDNNRLVLLSFRFAVCSIVLPPLTQNLNNRSVRTRAASALGKLSALSMRVDPLVSDLLSMLQVVLTSAHPLFSLF